MTASHIDVVVIRGEDELTFRITPVGLEMPPEAEGILYP
jgi:hypothetical protein